MTDLVNGDSFSGVVDAGGRGRLPDITLPAAGSTGAVVCHSSHGLERADVINMRTRSGR